MNTPRNLTLERLEARLKIAEQAISDFEHRQQTEFTRTGLRYWRGIEAEARAAIAMVAQEATQ